MMKQSCTVDDPTSGSGWVGSGRVEKSQKRSGGVAAGGRSGGIVFCLAHNNNTY